MRLRSRWITVIEEYSLIVRLFSGHFPKLPYYYILWFRADRYYM